MSEKAEKVRVRIAPSPTGKLHLGTARTALYNQLFARRHKGVMVLRMEDTDKERSKESYARDITEGLSWLGIEWDEGPDKGGKYGPYRQTEKLERYTQIAEQMIADGKAYYCYCTPEELEKQREEGEAPRYDNRCRNLTGEQIAAFKTAGRKQTIRFRIEEPREITWDDRIKGVININSSDLGGDMIIAKQDGMATYNFAVVVDDLDMEMTHIIRGEDHIHNTAKQILLYEGLGKPEPVFAHAALMFDLERHKLSKRAHGENVHIAKYKEDGYLPQAMVNYLAQMSWTPPEDREFFSLDEASEIFDLGRVSKSPAVFDIQKLNWFNASYIRKLPLAEITDLCIPYFPDDWIKQYSRPDLEKIVESVREGLTILSEIKEASKFYFQTEVTVSDELKESVLSKDTSQKVLDNLLVRLSDVPWSRPADCKAVVDSIGKEVGVKGKDLYWPFRAALSGSVQGPDLGSILSILGESRVKARLEEACKLCTQL